MDPTAALVIGTLIGIVLGGAAAWFASASAHARRENRLRTATASDAAEARLSAATSLAEAQSLRDQLGSQTLAHQQQTALLKEMNLEQVRQAERQNRELLRQFDEYRREQAERTASDNAVLQRLAPVQETLRTMQKTVADLEQQRADQHATLSEQLRVAEQGTHRLRSTAESLAGALRSNSTRGVWGETQLRRVVEVAGLIERVDFTVQHTVSGGTADSPAALRPDMIVHLPGGKHLAIDAKVPLAAYLEASSIPITAEGESGAVRAAALRQHVKAVRDHITALGSKEYWNGLESSPEMVIAFMPSESLISSALEADPGLLEFAFGKRVALASPVTLWSILKTVAFSWRQDVLTAEAQQLFVLSRELHSRLATMAGHIDKLGRSLDRGVQDYNRFVGSLERTVLPAARKLSTLEESTTIMALGEIESSTRGLIAPELASPDNVRVEDESTRT